MRVLGTRGRRFESCHSDYKINKSCKDTLLVQLVERRFPKPDAVGSSPTGRANFIKIQNSKTYSRGLVFL